MAVTEEVLKSNSAHWWSASGEFIAYAMFDDRNVPMYNFQRFGLGTNIYSDIDGLSYPKVTLQLKFLLII